jgi:hypothetical protein
LPLVFVYFLFPILLHPLHAIVYKRALGHQVRIRLAKLAFSHQSLVAAKVAADLGKVVGISI